MALFLSFLEKRSKLFTDIISKGQMSAANWQLQNFISRLFISSDFLFFIRDLDSGLYFFKQLFLLFNLALSREQFCFKLKIGKMGIKDFNFYFGSRFV